MVTGQDSNRAQASGEASPGNPVPLFAAPPAAAADPPPLQGSSSLESATFSALDVGNGPSATMVSNVSGTLVSDHVQNSHGGQHQPDALLLDVFLGKQLPQLFWVTVRYLVISGSAG